MLSSPALRDILFHIAIHAELSRSEPDLLSDVFPQTHWVSIENGVLSCPLADLKRYLETEGFSFQSEQHFHSRLESAVLDLNAWRTVRVAYISGVSFCIDTHAEDCIP